jgi:hypothetical protein
MNSAKSSGTCQTGGKYKGDCNPMDRQLQPTGIVAKFTYIHTDTCLQVILEATHISDLNLGSAD